MPGYRKNYADAFGGIIYGRSFLAAGGGAFKCGRPLICALNRP